MRNRTGVFQRVKGKAITSAVRRTEVLLWGPGDWDQETWVRRGVYLDP